MNTNVIKTGKTVTKNYIYLAVFWMLTMNLKASETISAQGMDQVRIAISVSGADLQTVFDAIKARTDYVFSFGKGVDRSKGNFTFDFSEISVGTLLRERVGTESGLSFKQVGNNISVIMDAAPNIVREGPRRDENLQDRTLRGG